MLTFNGFYMDGGELRSKNDDTRFSEVALRLFALDEEKGRARFARVYPAMARLVEDIRKRSPDAASGLLYEIEYSGRCFLDVIALPGDVGDPLAEAREYAKWRYNGGDGLTRHRPRVTRDVSCFSLKGEDIDALA